MDELIIPHFKRRTGPDDGLRKLFRDCLPQLDWCTVETGGTGGGVPDSNYCCKGIEGWIEYKRTDHWRVKVRPAQIGWIERRLEHGGRVYIAVRRARKELWMYDGAQVEALSRERLDAVHPINHWTGGPARWDWDAIVHILLS